MSIKLIVLPSCPAVLNSCCCIKSPLRTVTGMGKACVPGEQNLFSVPDPENQAVEEDTETTHSFRRQNRTGLLWELGERCLCQTKKGF